MSACGERDLRIDRRWSSAVGLPCRIRDHATVGDCRHGSAPQTVDRHWRFNLMKCYVVPVLVAQESDESSTRYLDDWAVSGQNMDTPDVWIMVNAWRVVGCSSVG